MRIDRIVMIKFKKAGSLNLKTSINLREIEKEASKQKRI